VVEIPGEVLAAEALVRGHHVPGSMARLGTMRDGPKVDLHAGSFDVDERAIGVGVRILVQTALDALDHYAV
jgi:metal-dependent amidase/aminoacylase/carboxypeptidase family protein